MKAIEQYFHVVLFIMLYKVARTFKSEYKTLTLVCEHSKKIHQPFQVELFLMTVDEILSWVRSELIQSLFIRNTFIRGLQHKMGFRISLIKY